MHAIVLRSYRARTHRAMVTDQRFTNDDGDKRWILARRMRSETYGTVEDRSIS